jgi:hypothetical protein
MKQLKGQLGQLEMENSDLLMRQEAADAQLASVQA